uniref:Family with sequence similarity 171 member A1 n=1 Tax=Neogobius melanostomus TaxID=47308 RepID=A0A8C6V507_9GOBI
VSQSKCVLACVLAIYETVTLKVHLSDANTHQPLGGATVQLYANNTLVATETSSSDGNAHLRFPYRLGTALVVTATNQGYVPNSVPWTPVRLPVFSSISLELLPERAASLMVYDDIVEIVSDFQGQPSVHFQRRALSLPPNTSYSNLTALFTVASSSSHIQHFPYLQGLRGNGTGPEKRFDLTPIAAVSVHLLSSDGVELQVNGPITVSVPLPADGDLSENDHIPAWRFDPRLGVWIKSSWGHVQKEGDQLVLTYIAPQLGYWLAAMSPLHTGPVIAKDISMYHTVFLLAILGGMALILLCLFCLLLYYCRRRCTKSRASHRKFVLASGLDNSKRDQATSMSHLNLINNEVMHSFYEINKSYIMCFYLQVQLELVSTATEPDMTTPMLKPSSLEPHDNKCPHGLLHQTKHSRSFLGNSSRHGSSLGNLTPRSRDYRQSVETFQLKAALPCSTDRSYRQSYTSVCSSSNPISDRLSSNHGQVFINQLSSMGNVDCISPSSPPHSPCRGEECRPPDYLLSRSVDNLERPVTPSLSRTGQFCGYSRVRPTLVIPAHYMRLPGEHPLSGQALLLQTDQQSDLETIQAELNASHSQQPLGQAPSNSTKLGEGREGLTLPESLSIPGAIGETSLVEINSEDTLLAEKTLMELRGGKPLPHPRAWFVSLDGRSNAHIRHSYIDLQRRHGNSNDASLDSGVDLNEPRVGKRRGEAENEGREMQEKNAAISDPLSPSSPSPLPSPEEVTLRTDMLLSPDEDATHEDGEEEKKSPWQRREERPLLSFNLK